MIVLKSTGGLCNRMRAIDSAIALAEGTGHRLEVIWEENALLNCAYDKLFKPDNAFEVKSIKRNFLYNTSHASVYGFPRKQVHGLTNRLMFSDTYFDNKGNGGKVALELKAEDVRKISDKKKVYIATGHSFFPSPHKYRHFVPVEAISQKVNEFSSGLNTLPIGLHIRRTDHAPSISESPDEQFELVMRNELQKDGSTKFFLATDSPGSEQHFKKMFGEAVLVYPKAWGRDSEQGIIDATIDLFLLSRCSKIYASFQSSFSETAATIGSIPLHVVKK